MLSLVDYGTSDEEDSNGYTNESNDTIDDEKPSNMFTNLPQPTTKVMCDIIEDDIPLKTHKNGTVLSKKQKQPIKIGVPSLAEFADDDIDSEPAAKKPKPIKGSGLFSVLPPPKGTPLTAKSFVPNAVTRKKDKPKQVQKRPLQILKKNIDKGDLESDDEFTELPETFDDETWQKVCGRKKKVVKSIPVETSVIPSNVIELAPEPEMPNNMLDNQAFKELVGNSKKPINITVIDINEEEILPDKDVWMTKSLTDPACAPKFEVTDPVNNTCKKKHHITYLVQQAKANEQDLKNQWAQNKYSRKQTQAKYGF